MQYTANVSGSQSQRPPELDTTSSPTTVYIRKNIVAVSGEFPGWQYDEYAYSTAEYIALLNAQIKAQGERADFMDDCIAEMAAQLYA